MPIPVRCPSCDHAFRVPDQYAGKRGKCPKCKSVFVAQAEDGQAEEFPDASDETAVASSGTRTVVVPKPKALAKVEQAKGSAQPSGPPPLDQTNIESDGPAAPPKPATPKAVASKPQEETSSPTVVTSAAAGSTVVSSPIVTSSGESGAVYAHRRKKKSNTPLVIGVGAIGLLLLLAVGGIVAWSMSNEFNWTGEGTQANATSQGDDDSLAQAPPPPSVDDNGLDSNSSASDGSASASLANWDEVNTALVDLTVRDAGGNTRSGRGVLVDRRGWIATSFTLVDRATDVVATFAGGDRAECSGLLVKRPRANLALLQIDREFVGSSRELKTQTIATSWTPGAGERVFLGAREEPFPTTTSGFVLAEAIPAGNRARLPDALRDATGARLLKFLVTVEDDQEGMPLLLSNGKVAGICVALGPTRGGYAVSAAPLVEMIASVVPGTVVAFDSGSSPPKSGVLNPQQPNPATPPDESFERFAQLVDQLADFGWRPETTEHYAGFQLLALGLNAMQSLIDDAESLPEGQRERMQRTIDGALERIVDAPIPDAEERGRINRLGLEAISNDESPERGVFLWGKCVMRPEDFGVREVDGLPGYAFQIVGTGEVVVMGIGESQSGRKIRIGNDYLILGTLDPGSTYELTLPEEELERKVYVVRSKYLLGGVK